MSRRPIEAVNPAERGRFGQMILWVLAQLGQTLGLFSQMLGVGVVLSMWRGQFHRRCCVAALLTMALGTAATGWVTFGGLRPWRAYEDALLWGGALATMGLSGLVAGRVGRRIAFWELYLATVVLAVVLSAHLGWGFEHLWPGGMHHDSELDYFTSLSRGVRLLGPMWDRLIGMGACLGFFAAVIGGSVAFLMYADGSQGDAGVGMEWWVARRHLQGQQHSTVSVTAVVAVLGIALGVASLVTVTAVMSGYQQDIQAKILSTNAHLVVQKYGLDFVEYGRIMRQAKKVDGVLAASAFTFNEAMINVGQANVGVLIKGVDPQTAADVTDIAANLCQPDTPEGLCVPLSAAQGAQALPRLLKACGAQNDVPTAIVGLALFRRLGQPLGTQVSITTPVGMAGGRGNAPRRMVFRLAGVFRSGMHEFDSRLIYLELGASQALMGMGQAVNGVELRVADPDHVEGLARQVLSAVGRYPYRSLDWRELNQGIFTALKLQKIVMFLVLAFIVVVASFNIASTLFMAVVEKSGEIAVLKSMGAKDGSIMKIFVFEGWITGLIGTVAGVLLGLVVSIALGKLQLGIAADVYMVDALQVRVRPMEVAITMAAALSISHLATLYPSLKAAQTRPVDVMRYD